MEFHYLYLLHVAVLLAAVDIIIVESVLDTKYDFSFDGNQGYWRKVLNQNVTPNEGYINVTMDNSCVVQIERQEIWRLYEEFQKNMLWDQDHLLVDIHLSTLAESAALQKTLIVKDFTFIKGSTKSQYRYLPLALDHFGKIQHLDPIGDLYMNDEFERFKIKVNGRMTDPCLKQVNQHYVTQLEPNKIQVPYTNGISRTFEDTLIATLIVIRDISPTLSIWEAFELRTLVGKADWFDMTCVGHDPGEGRPGVPYDMSRCCFFRSGKMLADGTQEDVDSSTRLLRLKRSIECREQIGDIHFLRKFSLFLVIVMMFFIPLCVSCFLSRPIPYRPLTKEQRKFPCDPSDVKPETEINGDLLEEPMKINGQVSRTRKDAGVEESMDEDPDLEYALGDAANYNHTDVRNRVYVDSDPEFHLDLHLILSYLFLCHIDNHVLIVIRRMVIIYGLWLLLGLACWVYGTYYPILLDEPFMSFQAKITTDIMELFFGKDRSLKTEFYHHIFILPFIALVVTFGTNVVLFLKKQSVTKSLYSTGEICFFGNKFPEHLATVRESRRVPNASRIKTFERLLFQNLVARIVNIFTCSFCRLWWKYWILQKCNPGKSKSTCEKIGKFSFIIFVWVPFSLILVLIHTLPMFAIWDNYLRKELSSCRNGKDREGRKLSRSKRLKCCISFLVQIIGIIMIYAVLWDLILCYTQFVVFISIDLIRNAADHIPKLILAFAILAYIKQAFWNFSDKYRELKMGTIQGLRDLHWEYREEYYHYNKSVKFVHKTPPHEVMWEFNDYGEISISRRFFYEVVAIYRPYKFYVIRMFTKLFITICVISLLIFVIIDFQILDQFNSAGQLLLTMFTVSLPLLIGAVRSPWQRELSIKRRHLNIRGWAERICNLVTEEKYPIPNEEDPKDSIRTDSTSVDMDLRFSKNVAFRKSPPSSLRYWSPTY